MSVATLAAALVASACGTSGVADSAGTVDARSVAVAARPAGVPGGPPDPASSAVRVGPTDPDLVIDLSLELRLADPRGLDRFLSRLRDPLSPDHRRFVDPTTFGARFGLPITRIDAVVAWLERAGLDVTRRHPQRTALDLRATVRSAAAVFGVGLDDYADDSGAVHRRVVGEPAIPRALRDAIIAVTGLDTMPKVAHSQPWAIPDPAAGLRPQDVAKAYGIGPLHEAGLRGAGQTIGIVSFDTFLDSDVAEFERRIGVASKPVERVPVRGGVAAPGKSTGEVNLDIDVVKGIAPEARIVNFEAALTSGATFGDMMRAIVAYNAEHTRPEERVDIVSISWGSCEPFMAARGVVQGDVQEFRAAEAQGINVFVASGDTGAYTCHMFQRLPDEYRTMLSTSWPSTSGSVIAVGGTLLSVREDGTYLEEAGWEDVLSRGGGGGGMSVTIERPEWQRGPGVDEKPLNGKRGVPDVAGPADPDSGFFVYYTEPGSAPSAYVVGGTSASSPFWAAAMLLARQLAQKEGVATLGYLNPLLYELAAATPDVFHDVTKGGNIHYDATPGWDFSTGLGSPDVAALARAIVDRLKQRPAGVGADDGAMSTEEGSTR